jgi:hypothetical protein
LLLGYGAFKWYEGAFDGWLPARARPSELLGDWAPAPKPPAPAPAAP